MYKEEDKPERLINSALSLVENRGLDRIEKSARGVGPQRTDAPPCNDPDVLNSMNALGHLLEQSSARSH
jgi:hypothetical protein